MTVLPSFGEKRYMYIDAYEKDCDPGEPDVVEGDGPVERVGRSSSTFREILNWLFITIH